jgi:hypothetical protein
MKLPLLLPVVVLPLLACAQSGTSLTGPSGLLTGTWNTAPVPSGGAVVLTLRSMGASVSGTDQEYGLMGQPASSGTISGQFSGGVFTLTVQYQGGGIATYVGHLIGTDTLDGTWTQQGPQAGVSLKFFRQ